MNSFNYHSKTREAVFYVFSEVLVLNDISFVQANQIASFLDVLTRKIKSSAQKELATVLFEFAESLKRNSDI